MSAEYNTDLDAALALSRALADMESIAEEKSTYEYEWAPPRRLVSAERDAAERIRSAIRHFAQDDEAAS